jgi:F0F1-type ATP synthase epsilon subunit
MSALRVRIITPQEATTEKEVTSAGFQAESGRLTVLEHHQPMICALDEGLTVLKTAEGEERWLTGKGILKVGRGEVAVLVHHAEMSDR